MCQTDIRPLPANTIIASPLPILCVPLITAHPRAVINAPLKRIHFLPFCTLHAQSPYRLIERKIPSRFPQRDGCSLQLISYTTQTPSLPEMPESNAGLESSSALSFSPRGKREYERIAKNWKERE